jgi:glycosyltransferase involved in cell wall biosynthesis
MSFQFSIIIICRNEATNIGHTLKSILSLSNDIVVYDSGSTDGTIDILEKFPVRLYRGDWEGFGPTRQKPVELSRHNWVLIVDADEVLTPALAEELKTMNPGTENTAYSVQLENHIGSRHIRYGSWGQDFRVRLYNKNQLRWNDSIVHEKLIVPATVQLIRLKHTIKHYTARNMGQLSEKLNRYALLTADQYRRQGKRSTWIKRNIGPVFAFIKTYFLKLGFLDGKEGYRLALVLANYTALKYRRLQGTMGHE